MKKTDPNSKHLEKRDITRRNFCQKSALVSGSLIFSTLPAAHSAMVAGEDVIKIALVGCGGRGTGAAIQALSTKENVRLIAMADAFEDRLQQSLTSINKKFGDTDKVNVPKKNQFVGFDGYKSAMKDADVVLLTTPPGFRPIHFKHAIDNGKHVFMEKPLATDATGIRTVLEQGKIAKQKQLNVVVGLQRHYQTNYRLIYDKIKSGAIGDIIAGQVYWNSDGVWVRKRTPEQSELEYQMRNWYYFNWLCGDHILEQHIHNIDVANWFIGGYPVSAQGMGGREIRKGKDHGQIFDHHFVEFTYENGAVISSQCRHQPGTASMVNEVFQGTKGTSFTSGSGDGKLADYKGNNIYKHRGIDDPNPYQVEHDELFSAIKNGEVINNVDYGAKSTMTAIMGRMATYSGKVISWDQALNATESLVPESMDWKSKPPVMPDAHGNYPIPQPGKYKVL